MARVKRGMTARRRRNKVLERASGYYGSGSRLFTVAKQMNDRALVFAYRDRKVRKRHFRSLWIARINAAARLNGVTYSELMGAILKSGVGLDRKSLAELAVHDGEAFRQVVQKAMGAGASASR